VTETPPGTGDLPTLRHEYDTRGVDVPGLDPDPLVQFGIWFAEAAAEGIYEPHAMTLGTVDDDGHPTVRYVLLRGVDERGFRFFTSYRSAKARDLDARGQAALTWGWLEQHRSVRATGPVARLPAAESDEYFASRPRGSQIAAWASHQSAQLSSRGELDRLVAEVEAGAMRRGADFLTFRRIAEATGLHPGTVAGLREHLVATRPARYVWPLWSLR